MKPPFPQVLKENIYSQISKSLPSQIIKQFGALPVRWHVGDDHTRMSEVFVFSRRLLNLLSKFLKTDAPLKLCLLLSPTGALFKIVPTDFMI